MAKPNFITGWTAATLAPKASGIQQQADSVQQSSQSGVASVKPPGTVGNPTTPNPVMMGGTPGSTAYLDQLKAAAMGNTGMGGTMSASVYQHPNAPAFLADAVQNLNSSQGFAQQNLMAQLLQQIMGGINSFPQNETLHETQTAAQKAADAQKVASAKAQAAANEHAAELNLTRMRSNATMTPPSPVMPATNSYPAYSGWTSTPSWAP